MRLLGIDYGTKRVGIALSDEGGRIAFPHTTISSKEALEEVQTLLDEYEIGTIVVGDSKDYNMQDNLVMHEIKEFVSELERVVKVPVVMHQELMSSMQVSKTHFALTKEVGRKTTETQRAKNIDARAAAIILQSYIDSVR